MKIFSAVATTILLVAVGATAQTTNTLSDAEIQGRALAQKILEQQPAENFTNTGVLQIRDGNGHHAEIPVKCKTIVTSADWRQIYEADLTSHPATFFVIHAQSQSNAYFYRTNLAESVPLLGDIPLLGHLFRSHQMSSAELASPFAGSDFWLCDLGLEFFHWPEQKVLKKEVHRSCGCTVLESTNPNPTTNGYSRVVSWIDNDSLGIVEAYAYDANGKKLKDFYPKDLKKVDGQYQVQSMIMENLQTGSKTRLEFDLKK